MPSRWEAIRVQSLWPAIHQIRYLTLSQVTLLLIDWIKETSTHTCDCTTGDVSSVQWHSPMRMHCEHMKYSAIRICRQVDLPNQRIMYNTRYILSYTNTHNQTIHTETHWKATYIVKFKPPKHNLFFTKKHFAFIQSQNLFEITYEKYYKMRT